jgi:drug/metabolite transporter (DMT)-like permease
MNRSRWSATAAALCAAVLFGASAPLSKLLLANVDPIPLAGILYFGAGIGAILVRTLMRWGQKGQKRETDLVSSDLPWLAGAILAGGVAAPILLLFGLRATPAATASLLLNFETVSTTLIAWLVFKEVIGKRMWVCVVLITLASILLSWDPAARWGVSPGALAITCACIFWGIDNTFTRNISAKNPLAIVAYKGIGASFCSVLLSFAFQQRFPDLAHLLPAILLGAFSYGFSIALFILAMRGLGAARTSALFSSAPFFGALIAFILLREPVAIRFLPALALMGLGAGLMFRERHSHAHIHAAIEHDHSHSHDDGHHTHTHPEGLEAGPGPHAHPHRHETLEHSHPHLPDIDHRHTH